MESHTTLSDKVDATRPQKSVFFWPCVISIGYALISIYLDNEVVVPVGFAISVLYLLLHDVYLTFFNNTIVKILVGIVPLYLYVNGLVGLYNGTFRHRWETAAIVPIKIEESTMPGGRAVSMAYIHQDFLRDNPNISRDIDRVVLVSNAFRFGHDVDYILLPDNAPMPTVGKPYVLETTESSPTTLVDFFLVYGDKRTLFVAYDEANDQANRR